MSDFKQLTTNIVNLNDTLRRAAVGSVNRMLTFRNWLIGRYIIEYEQSGSDRAAYGANLLPRLARQLRDKRGFSERNLQLFREFYRIYPQISQVISSQLSLIGPELEIPQSVTAELQPIENKEITSHSSPAELLVRHFSFTHFAELMRLPDPLKRSFYEIEGIRGCWSVSQLKRHYVVKKQKMSEFGFFGFGDYRDNLKISCYTGFYLHSNLFIE